MSNINDPLDELESLRAVDVGPFPYTGCRWLQGVIGEPYNDLIPDLDEYLSEFAGYRSWGKRILKWPDEKIAAVEVRLKQSFFDRFPRYVALKPLLASSQASDVRTALKNADRTRDVLLQLLSIIREGRDCNAP